MTSSTTRPSPPSASNPWSSCPPWSATTPPWPCNCASSASIPSKPGSGIEQPRYLGVGAGTGAVIPPLGFEITLSDQIRPVQIYALVDLGLLSLPGDRA